ncbi:lytic murein transglycosylase [Desulfovibrio sp. OttesenSCG-928-F20]|nr:lytic murein transglycosylase [Desulfovibrio sp. OttesenSCG-928-M16]MDL2290647.1 lytic murein transglycosylase [Desulfovibrio sp. OttesenSCG-928-F20]
MNSVWSFSRLVTLAFVVCLAAALLSGCGGARVAEPAPGAPAPKQDTAGKPVSPAAQPLEAPVEPVPDEGAKAEVQPPAPAKERRETAASRVATDLADGYSGPGGSTVPQCWLPLVQRLEADPKATAEVINYFCDLPEYSPNPMGVKVKELFTSAFLRKKKPDDGRPKAPPSRIYRNVVTAANMAKCEAFLVDNKELFDRVEQQYPVPREVLASLLYVETRLGTYVGRDNAFWSLACMAAADSPDLVRDGIKDIPITTKHDSWLQAKLADKSDWAYKELRALLAFCRENKLDPHAMPGSVYGAIGICQFMPSNLTAYGADGDGDGVINLFSEADAVFSAARYLSKHGWKETMTIDAQRTVLKRYNNLNIYANTILALAESIRSGVVQTGPPSSPISKKT